MADAGINTDLVTRHPTETGNDVYDLIMDGPEGVRVVFGPATTETGEPAHGFDIACYARGPLPGWYHVRQHFEQTPGGTVAAIKAWLLLHEITG